MTTLILHPNDCCHYSHVFCIFTLMMNHHDGHVWVGFHPNVPYAQCIVCCCCCCCCEISHNHSTWTLMTCDNMNHVILDVSSIFILSNYYQTIIIITMAKLEYHLLMWKCHPLVLTFDRTIRHYHLGFKIMFQPSSS